MSRVKLYGDFAFTQAVRPNWDVKKNPPEAGWRIITNGWEADISIVIKKPQPRLVISASAEDILPTLTSLLALFFPKNAGVRIKDMHGKKFKHPKVYSSLGRSSIVLGVCIWDFEEIMLNGCFKIAFHDFKLTKELGLDEHKLIYLAGVGFHSALPVLADHELVSSDDKKVGGKKRPTHMPFITQDENHFHNTDEMPGFKSFVQTICGEIFDFDEIDE